MIGGRHMEVALFLKLCWAPLAQMLGLCLYCFSS